MDELAPSLLLPFVLSTSARAFVLSRISWCDKLNQSLKKIYALSFALYIFHWHANSCFEDYTPSFLRKWNLHLPVHTTKYLYWVGSTSQITLSFFHRLQTLLKTAVFMLRPLLRNGVQSKASVVYDKANCKTRGFGLIMSMLLKPAWQT